jgi:hypothetical protein
MELVIPMTGEVLSRDDPSGCARAYYEIKELETKLRRLRGALAEVIMEESVKQGSKTLHFEQGMTAKISTPMEIQWDHDILAELVDAGLPGDRFEALVKAEVSFKIDGSIIRELEGANPVYAEIIDRARTRFPRTPSVTITAARTRMPEPS